MIETTSESTKVVRRCVFSWMTLIENKDRYYFPKAMDMFYTLPLPHQKGLLTHLVEAVDNKKLQDILDKDDNTLYPDVIRSVLFNYTGNADFGQPAKSDFKTLIHGYLKSKSFEAAEDPEDSDTEDFMHELEAI